MFKVGDKVRCINAEGNIFITNGVVYTVEKIDRRTLKVKGGWAMYESDKFEKVEDNMFTKDMLVAGKHVVEQKNGDLALFMVDGFSYLDRQGTNGLSWWNANLTSNYVSDQTIVKVYEVETSQAFGIYAEGRGLKLVWTRQEKTEAEKQLDELDKKIAELQEQADKVRKSMQDE